ncbi:hypothetical protein F5Y19DRAFT_402314 [Xylariaceae sp. FL1651]|nr:hypothetical protein F5Y19DRAFT_402314 [Xylariaceae sp. FL1651]
MSMTRALRNENPKEMLWMHVVMSNAQGPDAFAVASTHFENAKLTLAIMIGCSVKQMKRVKKLLEGSEDGITHPLLMLGICAELQLERLKNIVNDKVKKCETTTRKLEASRLGGTAQEITWDLINEVRSSRDEIKRAEEEVKATKRQLTKALPPTLSSMLSRLNVNAGNGVGNDDQDDDAVDAGNAMDRGRTSGGNHDLNSSDEEPDELEEITSMFSERFAEIFAQFEGLVAECRINMEEMSFTADIIRSELARQETKTSTHEAKMSTVIAFVAMLYLPMTTTATIFAMPVFQFPYDWRDWQWKSWGNAAGESLSGSTSNPSTTGSSSPNPPVFSGYFYIYLAISVFLTLLTLEGWWQFTTADMQGGMHWTIFLVQKVTRIFLYENHNL